MGLAPGNNAALTNASLVELGKQLLTASREGDKAEVRKLLAKGAPMTTDWLGTSPLHLAAQYGHAETAEILLRSGCQRDARTKVEKTPLHVAAQEGHDGVAELLLQNGADVDATDMLKMTALHWAVERGQISAVETLLRFGANVNLENKFGKSPLEISSDINRPDIFEMLQNPDQFRMATHLPSSDEATLAATQSILPEELVEIQDSVPPVAEHEEIINFKQEPEQNNEEAVNLLAAHGITLLPEDCNAVEASKLSSDPTRKFTLTEAGKLALGIPSNRAAKIVTTSNSTTSALKPTITRIVRLNAASLDSGAKSHTLKLASSNSGSSSAPKIIKVTPQQFAALKAGNPAKVTTLSQLQSGGLKRKIITTTAPSTDNRALKIVRVNPAISIQAKKPSVTTLVTSSPSASALKPGYIVKTNSAPTNTAKTIVVTSSASASISESPVHLKRQIEEFQKTVEDLKNMLKQKELENEKLRKMLAGRENSLDQG